MPRQSNTLRLTTLIGALAFASACPGLAVAQPAPPQPPAEPSPAAPPSDASSPAAPPSDAPAEAQPGEPEQARSAAPAESPSAASDAGDDQDAAWAAWEAEQDGALGPALLTEEERTLDELRIIAPPEGIRRTAGSAQVLDEATLEQFEDDDVHQVVQRVPGVYVRGEDGHGLRPNIGMRGVNPDRSKKVVLMEDGVLFGPAPYSAPAAYYFPLVSRMANVLVFKGPAAVRYGPNSIGGALDFRTATVPLPPPRGRDRVQVAKLDLALGSFGYGKAHLRYGMASENIGYVIEGLHVQSDGFKELDGGGDTGFQRDETMLKWRINTDVDADTYQALELKLGLSLEDSDETYLGLTDTDFADNPNRRYRASQLDHMRWHRGQIALSHYVALSEDAELTTTVYRHDFTRGWNKANRFAGSELEQVLSNPDALANRVYYDVLTGEEDAVSGADTLMVGLNHRQFVSQGVQSELGLDVPGAVVSQRWSAGVRVHNDSIERRHSEDGYLMRTGDLVRDAAPTNVAVRNRGETTALALHAVDEIAIDRLLLSPGLRAEFIWTEFTDRETASEPRAAFQVALLPGLGAYYQLTESLGALIGAYRGFSPTAPQPVPTGASAPEAEYSINYELGARFQLESVSAEVIGFLNDYSNLTGTCSFSSGCADVDVDRQFDGGAVQVYGAEAMVRAEPGLGGNLTLPLAGAYTMTGSEFLSSFSSGDPTFGDVQVGDELPYVPRHQLSLTVGVAQDDTWGLDVSSLYVSKMRESAGVGEIALGEGTDDPLLFSAAGRLHLWSQGLVYANVSNLFGAQAIAARRPFGARPAAPRAVHVGFKLDY
jgi:Fe(3+) dicitrate transport protein